MTFVTQTFVYCVAKFHSGTMDGLLYIRHGPHEDGVDQNLFPQHEPGPLHPASATLCPQHAVSAGPGIAWGVRPVRLLVGEINFSVCVLPQAGHLSEALLLNSITSP